MKSFKALALTLVLTVVGSFASAQVATGKAGCGLGNIIFGDKDAQSTAATFNGSTQFWALMSGTSNCGPSVFSSAEAKAFIENNAVALENDAVRGQGETVATLSKMMGCEGDVLSSSLKSNYKEIYSDKALSNQKVLETAKNLCPVKG